MSQVHPFPIVPRRVAHDVTDTDVAARVRLGHITTKELYERFQHSPFAEWFERQGQYLRRQAIKEQPSS